MKLLREYLSHGAEACGFRGEVWMSRRVAEVIEVEFGVTYHPTTVLKKLKWTPHQPIQCASQWKLLVIWDSSPIYRGQPVHSFLEAGASQWVQLERLPPWPMLGVRTLKC